MATRDTSEVETAEETEMATPRTPELQTPQAAWDAALERFNAGHTVWDTETYLAFVRLVEDHRI